MNPVSWQDYDLAAERHADRLRWAERERLVRAATANQAAVNGGVVRRALVRLGVVLATVGVALQGSAQS